MSQMNINMTEEQEKEEITENDWNQLFEKGTIKKEEMDKMVMQFLINKDLAVVADTFQRESGCQLAIEDLSPLETQTVVAYLLFERQFDKAINLLNEKLGLNFLKDRRKLHFRLVKQKMIEFKYKGDMKGAYEFTPEFLEWGEDIVFMKEVVETMSDLFYGNKSASSRASRVEFLRSYYLGNIFVKEIKNFFHGPEKGNSIEKAMKTLGYVENELNKVVKFPNFNIDSGYPELLPHQQNDV